MNSRRNKNISLGYLILRPFVVLLGTVLLGAFGYMKIEGLDFLDSLFTSVEILVTVGLVPIKPLSDPGKIFSIIYMLFAVILFLYVAAEFAEYVIYTNFRKILSKKTMEGKLKKVKGHYIVCGYGRTGAEIVSQLQNNKLDFVVIDKDPEFEQTAQDFGFLYVLGDATEDEVLEKAGISSAKGLFCALSDDVDNLYLTVSARSLNTEMNIVARCIKASNEQKFRKAGASNIILPYEISGRRMVASIIKPLVVDFLDVVTHTQGQELELKLEQFQLKSGSALEDKTIRSSELRQKTGVIIVAVKRNNHFMTNPGSETVLKAGDYLITLGTNDELSKFEKLFV